MPTLALQRVAETNTRFTCTTVTSYYVMLAGIITPCYLALWLPAPWLPATGPHDVISAGVGGVSWYIDWSGSPGNRYTGLRAGPQVRPSGGPIERRRPTDTGRADRRQCRENAAAARVVPECSVVRERTQVQRMAGSRFG